MGVTGCPACGTQQQIADGASAFRCGSCQRDVWIIRCHKCHIGCRIYGSATGAGAVEFRCGNCRARNNVPKPRLREISADARRLERTVAAARKGAAARRKEAAAHHTESRQSEVERLNRELKATVSRLKGTLAASLSETAGFSFASLKIFPRLPEFVDPSPPAQPGPRIEAFVPPEPTGLGAHMPGAKRKHDEQVQAGKVAYEQAQQHFEAWESQRRAARNAARADYDRTVAELQEAARHQNDDVDELERKFKRGEPEAVVEYVTAALAHMTLPYDIGNEPLVAFSLDSRQVVIELELPTFEVVPEAREYRYVKTRDEITEIALSATERKAIYASLISQVALQTISESFRSDIHGTIETVILNGHVHTVDRRTGQEIHPCLVTVRTTRDRFGEINLRQVDPAECLKGLNASISKNPSELAPVRPILEFNMADPRFITESDVLSTLDTRPNLMDLTFSEFESLITNLFQKMGLETKLTQASRDGGVDCVAYDTRPILGGKVVIQAKRYKNTVGVSAVRDLYGTMQNEGATKGILVATSGYGKASHEFANGKPLELIDGANLLYLLHEHAEIDAKIAIPENWEDPPPPR